MKKLMVLTAVGLLLVATAAAQAKSRGGDEPVKWSQLPEMVNPWGFDVESDFDPNDGLPRQVVMDDWLCETGLPVTDVHWWGSYFDNVTPSAFHISIHSDIPAGAAPSAAGSTTARLPESKTSTNTGGRSTRRGRRETQ